MENAGSNVFVSLSRTAIEADEAKVWVIFVTAAVKTRTEGSNASRNFNRKTSEKQERGSVWGCYRLRSADDIIQDPLSCFLAGNLRRRLRSKAKNDYGDAVAAVLAINWKMVKLEVLPRTIEKPRSGVEIGSMPISLLTTVRVWNLNLRSFSEVSHGDVGDDIFRREKEESEGVDESMIGAVCFDEKKET
ncbi:hypothetical protein L6452_00920 [Arctium lappa]|uniref:Uncharacterized protein n=1 Tax=Arctium lappa TaxID=4217 RepID=A0ACB9FFG4_ARCLA|nr:hypothetical protein L6452_00920 [Arctium lappa]